jgi:hypothetical protein
MSGNATPGRAPARELERLTWFDGSALAERDLDDAVAYEQRMLELHVRAVHDTWGVALGLTLTLGSDRRAVLVSPGLAYDCRGQSIVLGVAVQLDAPLALPGVAGPSAFDLVLAPPAPAEGAPCEPIATCAGDVPPVRAALRWEHAAPSATPAPPGAAGIRLGEEIPLGRFARAADGTLTGPDASHRRIARGLARPHVAFGVTRPGELLWQPGAWDTAATIDTAAAGFTTHPLYFAWVLDRPWTMFDIGPFVSVGQSTRTSFRLHLLFGSAVAPPPMLIAELMLAQRTAAASARIMWLGVEMTTGCPPSLLGASLLDVAGRRVADLAPWLATLATLGATP